MSASDKHNSNQGDSELHSACPAFEQLSAYVDGELGASEQSTIQEHLAHCLDCGAIITDLNLLSSALIATTPIVTARSFALTPEMAGLQERPSELDSRRPKVFPCYPVFSAIAAVLVIALIAGDMIFGDSSTNVQPTRSSDETLMINGTPFTPADNDAQFGAASAEDLSPSDRVGEPVPVAEETNEDDRFFTGWRIAQTIAIFALLVLAGLWYLNRASPRARLRS